MRWLIQKTNRELDATEEPKVSLEVELDNYDLAKLYEHKECNIDMGDYGKLAVSVINDVSISLVTPTAIQLSGETFYSLLRSTEIIIRDKDHEPTIEVKITIKLRGQRT